MTRNQQYKKLIEKFGIENQIIIAVEELSELQKELCKYLRGKHNIVELSEEMADVKIMFEQLEFIFSNKTLVEEIITKKVERTEERYLKE